MVTTKLNLSMTEPQVRQIYAKQGDTGRVLDITLDQTPEDGTLRILRPDGVEVTSEAVTGGEVSESGETVTFESLTEADVTELKVSIEPIQDLSNGDPSPTNICPIYGGNETNLLDASVMEKGFRSTTVGDSFDNILSAAGNRYLHSGAFNATQGLFFQITSHDLDYLNWYSVNMYNNDILVARQAVALSSADTLYTYTVPKNTYEVVAINLGGSNVTNTVDPTKGEIQLNLGTSVLPYVPYQSIRVDEIGKNLCPTFTSGTKSGLTYDVGEDGSVHVTGTCTGTAFWALPFALPKGTYVLSGAPSGGQLTIRNGDGGSAPSSAFSGGLDDYGNGATFTVSETASAWLNIRSTAGTHDKMYYPMIRLASVTDNTYEPYQSNTYTTSLGQTVYGGTLDMVSGVLTVDKAMVDLGSLSWSRYTDVQDAYVYLASLASQGMDTSSAKLLSSAFKCRDTWTALNNLANGEMQSHPSLADVYARCDSYTSASDFITAMTGQQLVYELATPLTYTLTAQQIKTLVGTNNVWASSGDIVNITFTYGGLFSELPSEATEIVGKCYCDVEQNGVSSMPFTLNVKKNERAT